ncbi:hypothetical protein SUGI_0739290 [Cryptomeria japonica]|uniref:calmodulin-binding protein 60 D isoform X2 n=1 Tax=Cryptomeria japonica TaxID=3369 RepID=UPI0024146B97|nr:calmodulin-binding protein 60 D isoform X2 [Cryptomeria japonica]GLJ36726.1 hypothetical protein SUGI_0739290 [Cryptomeria japonica]
MAQKRGQKEKDDPSPDEKRPRLPSFAATIAEAVKVNTLQKFCSILEPLLRRVVNEEVERALEKHVSTKSQSSTRQIGGYASQNLQLRFRNRLSLPIFTGSRIEGEQCNFIQVVLIDATTGQIVTEGPESSMKVEIVVLEGDFEGDEEVGWTEEDFDNHVVREREGKRPLLAGELIINLKEGVGVLGELTFTDNSSWIRSRKFKLGARIIMGSCEAIRIREAKTEAFTVKDHRGELYKKHYPPVLHDEVWRLEKIGKDGAFHKRLNSERIFTVQDFLRLMLIDPQRLRNVLGTGMSNKMWEGTVDHAKTCVLDNKLYAYYADEQHTLGVIFNVVCEPVGVLVDGRYILVDDLSETQKVFVSKMVKYTYEHWNEVVEYDASSLMGNTSHRVTTLPSHGVLSDDQVGEDDINSQVAVDKVSDQCYHSLDPSNGIWTPYSSENSIITMSSQFAARANFAEQCTVPQNVLSSALALGTERVVMNPLQSSYDTQILGPYSHFQNECIGQIHNEYVHPCIEDQCIEPCVSQDSWNLDCHEGLEDLSFTKSAEKLENQILDAQLQSLIQSMTAGTSIQQNSLFNNSEKAEAFCFSVFTPTSNVSISMSTRRLHGKAYVFWLKLKAALKWGITVRKVAAAKRAKLVEIED